MNLCRSITDEDGSVLVIAVVILALLTVIGMAATSTTSIELQIASNERTYKENFYQAEGAAMMLVRVLEDLADDTKLIDDPPTFSSPAGSDENLVVKGSTNDVDETDITNPSHWEGTNDLSCEMPGIASDNAPRVIARREGYAPGSSESMVGGNNLYQYSIFGRREKNNSAVVIHLGYRKRH